MTFVRRLWALAALVSFAASVGLAVALAVDRFPRGLAVLACLVVCALAARGAVLAAGAARWLAAGLAVAALGGAVAFVVLEGRPLLNALVIVLFAFAALAANRAFRTHVSLPPAPAPQHPVLFFNPKSGGGKAERFHLADAAAAMGIEAVELKPGEDLRELVAAAVRDGADALAMAGGDGSQAIVADIAAQHDLPYACIPAGTRNHFALDLGVDRDDVVGALAAFDGGGERRVDLAEVNGRVFVNNVSLGIYAEAVQREEYRGAKLRTLASTTAAAAAEQRSPALRFKRDGASEAGVLVLVSNNSYRLGSMLGSGTRPRLDGGRLGIAALCDTAPGGSSGGEDRRQGRLKQRQWHARRFEIDADGDVPAGIDGEAAVLQAPLRFRSIPGALRVRIAAAHPGASPSAIIPANPLAGLAALVRFAFGRADAGPATAPPAPVLAEPPPGADPRRSASSPPR